MAFLSAQHLIVLAVTLALCVGLGLAARRDPGARWITPLCRGLAVLLIASEVAFRIVNALDGGLTARGDLPLHLTDAATVVAAIALWFPGAALAFELTYFWAMTATLQALLTPDLRQAVPRLPLVVVLHRALGRAGRGRVPGMGPAPDPAARRGAARLRMEPRRDGARGGRHPRVRGQLHVPAQPPEQGSLLDLMGPWPWYIASGAALALALFWLLDRPFDGRPERRRSLESEGTTRTRRMPDETATGLAGRLDADPRPPCGRATSCASARSAARVPP